MGDPPYVSRFCSRDGRTIVNDDNADWLRPAFAEMYRVLRYRSFCVSFYGWHKADLFIAAWRAAVRLKPLAGKHLLKSGRGIRTSLAPRFLERAPTPSVMHSRDYRWNRASLHAVRNRVRHSDQFGC
jgi:hypothetical protein